MIQRHVGYRSGPVTVRAAIPDGILHEAAELVFPDYQIEDPGGGEPDLRVDTVDAGRFELSVQGEAREAAPLAEAFVRYELALAEMLLAGSGGVALHGGAVLGGNGAVLFSGPSSSGKSTLSVGLAAGGRPVFGDDVVLLDPRAGTISPFKRLMKLTDPASYRPSFHIAV